MPRQNGQMMAAIKGALGEAADKAIADGEAAMAATPPVQQVEPPVPVAPVEQPPAVEPETDDGEAEVEYVNDLPETLGMDATEFYNLRLKLSDDSEPVPLGQVKDRLQQLERERGQVEAERQRLQQAGAEMAQRMAAAGQQRQVVTQDMQAAQAELEMIGRAMPVLEKGWAEKEAKDPGAVALERQKVGEKFAMAQSRLQQATHVARNMGAQAEQLALRNEDTILAQHLPGWADPRTKGQLQAEIASFAMNRYGATPQDLARINAKSVMMLHDALQAEKARTNAARATSGATGASPQVPKGTRVKSGALRKKATETLETKARSTRRRGDVTAAVRGILTDVVKSQRHK